MKIAPVDRMWKLKKGEIYAPLHKSLYITFSLLYQKEK